MMRQIQHRTSQVRNLTFMRDAILQKAIGNTKTVSGSSAAISGPGVSFGYEEIAPGASGNPTFSMAVTGNAANTAYLGTSPELIYPGLPALQTPIVSRSGQHERSGHRITGACKFFVPSLGYIKGLPLFARNVGGTSTSSGFDEFETYDKLIDVERIVQQPNHYSGTLITMQWTWGESSNSIHDNKTPGDDILGPYGDNQLGYGSTAEHTDGVGMYEMDRLQFKIKSAQALDYVMITARYSSQYPTLKWDGNVTLDASEFLTIDLPIRNIVNGDMAPVYTRDGGYSILTAAVTGSDSNAWKSGTFWTDLLSGGSTREINQLDIKIANSAAVEVKDVYFYKEAEWRIESIKDYRNEYMELGAVRVRGDRTSRRRAYGGKFAKRN